jgi:hypothetical protein
MLAYQKRCFEVGFEIFFGCTVKAEKIQHAASLIKNKALKEIDEQFAVS